MMPNMDSLITALENPTISPEQEMIDSEAEMEDEGPETLMLHEILCELADIKSLLRRQGMQAAMNSQKSQGSAAQSEIPAYSSTMLEL